MSHMCRSEALLSPPERLLIFVHTEEVRGSKPRSPTLFAQVRGPVHDLGRGLGCPAHTEKPKLFSEGGGEVVLIAPAPANSTVLRVIDGGRVSG